MGGTAHDAEGLFARDVEKEHEIENEDVEDIYLWALTNVSIYKP
jgi:hypothetical protein